MAYRCTDCNKFCSTEIGDPSVDDITVDLNHEAMATWKPGEPSFLSINVAISCEKVSECCQDTVAEAREETDFDVEDEDLLTAVKNHYESEVGEDEHEIEAEEESVVFETEGTGRKEREFFQFEYSIHCCLKRLGEGTESVDLNEWESYS